MFVVRSVSVSGDVELVVSDGLVEEDVRMFSMSAVVVVVVDEGERVSLRT